MVAGEADSSSAERALPQPLSREEVHIAFAAALRDGTATSGLRQRELATRVGVSPGRISQYLNYPEKMPARWERITELLSAAGAPVEEFAQHFGSFWPDHPDTSSDTPDPGSIASEPTAAGDGAVIEQTGEETGGHPGDVSGPLESLEAATMADAYAARTGVVLPGPLADLPESDLEVPTELGLTAEAGRSVAPTDCGRFPDSGPVPAAREGRTTFSTAVGGAEADHSRRLFVEEAPTGPVPLAPTVAPNGWHRRSSHRRLRVWMVVGVAAPIVAGVMVAALSTRPLSPPPAPIPPTPVPLLLGVVEGAGPQGLTERTYPLKAPQHRTERSLKDGSPVAIDCAQVGDPVVDEQATGYSTTWLRLQDGFYVTSVFVRVAATTVNPCMPGPPLPLTLSPR